MAGPGAGKEDCPYLELIIKWVPILCTFVYVIWYLRVYTHYLFNRPAGRLYSMTKTEDDDEEEEEEEEEKEKDEEEGVSVGTV